MKTKLITMAVAALILSACTQDVSQEDIDRAIAEAVEEERESNSESEPEPEPEQEEEDTPAHGTYGSDAGLDRLYDQCEDGDMQACDDLYLDSPLGSEYETFGDTCGGRQNANTGVWCAEDAPSSNSSGPGTYGSDPYFDNLWDQCDAGDLDACSTLFWESPVDSEYEEFGLDNMYPSESGLGGYEYSGELSEQQIEAIFEEVWSGYTASERENICWTYDFLGPEESYNTFWAGEGFTQQQVTNFFDSKC